jgi:hypothetical protein
LDFQKNFEIFFRPEKIFFGREKFFSKFPLFVYHHSIHIPRAIWDPGLDIGSNDPVTKKNTPGFGFKIGATNMNNVLILVIFGHEPKFFLHLEK